ncbi:MAG: hypothetical protein EPN69_03955 [Rhodanobacter sp.]|nr:MAG: hypothetical protein EPN71_12100 [Rhodanobacter sp.]TAL96641.1 MAG: hypothetical protein EPN69_03955 [Rhodanobacter sp.]TAM42999.1 MAG: hypothetical protein EPN58_01115 [Rhodanobacter sp.]TAN28156.1 MAG: hypothetical protein EPN32_03630 [Rhodanobacter sp.]
MKKTSLLVALPAVALSGLLLSGCGMFRSHSAWKSAQQESPLEIPPSIDRPSTSDALVIPPPGANQPTANGVTASVAGVQGQAGQISDGFMHPGSVDSIYQRVGQALAGDSLGQVLSHDDVTHTYVVSVTATEARKKRGFFGRLFRRHKEGTASTSGGGVHQVQISINSSAADASEVRAQSDSLAVVANVIDALKSKLGKK